jgi:hypothetical protein
MAMAPLKTPITASTQQHLDVEDMQDDLVILKDGGVALVLETTAVNFGLLSETEQDAAIYAYAGLLNSLTFPIQIVIRNRQMDISSYVKLLKEQEDKQSNESLRFQINRYRQFIESIIRENNVLDKRFYIIIPFSPFELGASRAAFSLLDILNPLKKKRGGLPYPKSYILEKAKNALYPKKEHIVKQLARIGLRTNQLTTQELIELFYDIYNPTKVSSQKITAAVSDYRTPLVTPAVEQEEKPNGTDQEAPAKAEPEIPSSPPPAAPKPPKPPPPTPAKAKPVPVNPSGEKQSPPPPGGPGQSLPEEPGPSSPPAAGQSESLEEPSWLKRVQERVAKDLKPGTEDRGAAPSAANQPRLARIQPLSREEGAQVIGGRVASPPGQVSQQTATAPPKSAGKQEGETIYQS